MVFEIVRRGNRRAISSETPDSDTDVRKFSDVRRKWIPRPLFLELRTNQAIGGVREIVALRLRICVNLATVSTTAGGKTWRAKQGWVMRRQAHPEVRAGYLHSGVCEQWILPTPVIARRRNIPRGEHGREGGHITGRRRHRS